MIANKRVLGIIPARAGSKGIRDKNAALIGNKTLIEHAGIVALASKCDFVVLSTESDKYQRLASQINLDSITRPQELADDTTPMIEVIQDAVNQCESTQGSFDIIVILQPTSPYRTTRDVNCALEILTEKQGDSVVSVVEVPNHCHPYSIMMEKEGKLHFPLNPGYKYSRRQDFPKAYMRNGAIYVFQRNLLQCDPPTLFGDLCLKYEMSDEFFVNIDAPEDLEKAQSLWEAWPYKESR